MHIFTSEHIQHCLTLYSCSCSERVRKTMKLIRHSSTLLSSVVYNSISAFLFGGNSLSLTEVQEVQRFSSQRVSDLVLVLGLFLSLGFLFVRIKFNLIFSVVFLSHSSPQQHNRSFLCIFFFLSLLMPHSESEGTHLCKSY